MTNSATPLTATQPTQPTQPTKRLYQLVVGRHTRFENNQVVSYVSNTANDKILLTAHEAAKLGARVRIVPSRSTTTDNPWLSVVLDSDLATILTIVSSLDNKNDIIQFREAETSHLDREEVLTALTSREQEL